MALTKFTGATNNIQVLPDKPNQDGGFTAAQLKLKFDQIGIDIANYLNSTLTTEADATFATRTELNGIVLGQVPDGSITDAKLSNAPGQIKSQVGDITTKGFIGDNSSGTKTSTNIDAINKSGYYVTENSITIDGITDWFLVNHTENPTAPKYSFQIASALQQGERQYMRSQINGTWTPWVRVVNQSGAYPYSLGGSANNYTLTLPSTPNEITVIPNVTNNANATITINSVAYTLKGRDAQNIKAGDFVAGVPTKIARVGSDFFIISSIAGKRWADGTIPNNYHYVNGVNVIVPSLPFIPSTIKIYSKTSTLSDRVMIYDSNSNASGGRIDAGISLDGGGSTTGTLMYELNKYGSSGGFSVKNSTPGYLIPSNYNVNQLYWEAYE